MRCNADDAMIQILVTVTSGMLQLSNKQGNGLIYKQHLELGFDLTEFHEFCCLSVSAGGYQEIRKKGPNVGIT